MTAAGDSSEQIPEHPLDAALALKARQWPRPEVGIGPPDTVWRSPVQVWTDGPLLDRMLLSQARFTPDLDRKGQGAYLMIAASQVAATLSAACLVGAGIVPRLSADAMGYEIVIPAADDTEERSRARLFSRAFTTDRSDIADHPDAEPVPDRAALCDALRRALEGHFATPVEAIHLATGLSRGALWRLAGDAVAGQFLDAGRRFGCQDQATADALRVLKAEGSPLANREMYYFDVTLADPKRPGQTLMTRTFRARGGCCRWYTSATGKICTACVLRSDADRRATIEGNLRRRLGLPPLSADGSAA